MKWEWNVLFPKARVPENDGNGSLVVVFSNFLLTESPGSPHTQTTKPPSGDKTVGDAWSHLSQLGLY